MPLLTELGIWLSLISTKISHLTVLKAFADWVTAAGGSRGGRRIHAQIDVVVRRRSAVGVKSL